MINYIYYCFYCFVGYYKYQPKTYHERSRLVFSFAFWAYACFFMVLTGANRIFYGWGRTGGLLIFGVGWLFSYYYFYVFKNDSKIIAHFASTRQGQEKSDALFGLIFLLLGVILFLVVVALMLVVW